MTPPDGELRVGPMTIPANAVRWWYGLFGFLTVYLTVTNTLTEAARTNAAGWQEIQAIGTVKLTEAGAASLIASAIIVEVAHVVFGEMLRKRRERRALAQGREEGRAEGEETGEARNQALWESWNQRRLEAEARGEPFTEPPPTRDNHNGAAR